MKILSKFRQFIVHKLIRPNDGYTFTGFCEGEPLKFYYQEDTGKYLLGQRCGNMYYCEPTLTSWTAVSSRCLPWGKDGYPSEPQEIDFQRWLYGIQDNINEQYKQKLNTARYS